MEELSTNPQVFDSDKPFANIADKALGVDLVRDKILQYVIYQKDKVLFSNVFSLRLVNKAWQKSTSRVLLTSQQPLLRFYLSETHFWVGASEKVDKFAGSQTESIWGILPVHPYAIESTGDPLRLKSHPSLFNCLVNYGGYLTELHLELSEHHDKISLLRGSFSLPKLRKFHVVLVWTEKSNCPAKINDKIDFIRSVFHATDQLKEFKIKCQNLNHCLPESFDNVRFPSSLTSVDFGCKLNSSNLEVLAKNSLPKLKTLKFLVNDRPYQQGLVTRILKNVRKSLEHLCVNESHPRGIDNHPTTFQLPFMEKLKKLEIEAACLQLEEESSFLSLQVLTHITFPKLPIPMFRKWTGQSCFHSVTSLTISFVPENFIHFRESNPSLSTMETVKSAFPKLQDLDLTFVSTDVTVLKFIMTEMRSLQRLRILIEYAGIWNSDVWDACLIGIPMRSVAALRKSPDSFGELEHEINASIRNLTDLHTLELATLNEGGLPMISEAAFDFAFFKMPKLAKLILAGDFYATKQVQERWESEGRAIEITSGER